VETAALVFVALACAAIIILGARFLLTPDAAVRNFGVAPDDARALAATKGIRDITSGIVVLVVWLAAGREAAGWAFLAAALTAIGDAVVVRIRSGRWATALGVHGLTATLMIISSLIVLNS
jgi:hypothetical protein